MEVTLSTITTDSDTEVESRPTFSRSTNAGEVPPDLGPYHAAAAAASTPDAFAMAFGWPGCLIGTFATISLLRYGASGGDALAYVAIGAIWLFYFGVMSAAWWASATATR